MQQLPAIPLLDMRAGGPVAHAAQRRADLDELRALCLGYYPKPLHVLFPLADTVARRWFARCASPYVGEIAEIARIARAPGVFAVNMSYEWGCTAAVGHGGAAPLLARTLDWPFSGLGRKVALVRQSGPAGEFWNVTWPGAVGVLTALAPGRFAATINQAPLKRRTRGNILRFIDFGANAMRTLACVRHAPPAHVLRQVFETARDYAEAKAMLAQVPMARPVLIALAGVRPGESCLIEREETEARVIDGPIVVANDWQQARAGWEARSCGGPHETDSRDRRAALATRVKAMVQPFDWLAPPIHNWATRIAVEMNAGDGTLRVVGFEPIDATTPSARATQVLDLASVAVAA